MIKSALKFAWFCGVFLAAVFQVSIWMDGNPITDFRHFLVNLVIFGVFIFAAIKNQKDTNGSVLHFWQGMTVGFWVYTVGTALFLVYVLIYFSAEPSAISAYQDSAKALLEKGKDVYIQKIGEEGYQSQLQQIAQTTKWDLIWRSAMQKILTGFFVTPVISIILRKQPNS
ncbi:DUF4199 domain-containing protein [Marinoscillum furvescens]|uniref:Uncharacterized protein DUF4199 n=1 Tax=Marinoscillum furvescens DSM 4134 TaxID=1122208 RepID=A0A3D9KYW7_MARFU|nr:DUF4199 domain-containing protein [Marinoscillum furvescens]RED91762.1 uncharacterized protein DUF4199 [Marinoscillum furvescens DSM 4134]